MDFNTITIAPETAQRLSQAALAHRLPHALIIEGGSANDRLSLAQLLARAQICSGDAPPCGECTACKKALKGFHPDVSLNAATAEDSTPLRVDAIRQLRSEAYVFPNEAKNRVFILHNMQLSNEQAQNALLKILEEPPEYVRFIITCSNASALLETILSRAALYSLGQETEDTLNEKHGKACECAEQIAAALVSPNEFDLMRATGPLEKDTELFLLVLVQLRLILRDTLMRKQGANIPALSQAEPQVPSLARSFTAAQLIKMAGTVDELEQSLARNANKSLAVTRLCSLLSGNAGR